MKVQNFFRFLPWLCLTVAGYANGAPSQIPLFLGSGAKPMVMFAMSVDHQLFKKAFADYSDLSSPPDGIIETTYTDSFDYYGYFDSNRCYSYNASGYFEPEEEASGGNLHHCNGGTGGWSGNFLNWATMTRMDVLRKVLYGGKRAVDDPNGQTILERALLPNDVHSFVKVFSTATTAEMQNYTPYPETTISLCSTTREPPAADDSSDLSQSVNTSTYHPKMRIARGDWGRWAADEVYQCAWRGSGGNGVSAGTDHNVFDPNGSGAPSVRVATCVEDKREANCRQYAGADPDDSSDDTYKPSGVLQDYGEDGTLRFGLMSGSYQNRDDGGRLRKVISDMAGNSDASDDEINLADGTFNTGVNGIISTLNKIRINSWDFGSHVYRDCDTYGISIDTYLTSSAPERKCSNWGNPISELYLEAVRYLAGAGSATPAFVDGGADPLGLPTATWNDPMASDEWCAPMNVVLLSSGDNSFDRNGTNTAAINDATDEIGDQEEFSGYVFIGDATGSATNNTDSFSCTAKEFDGLEKIGGLCPASPTKQGGYAVAGIAYQAHITDLRDDRQNDPLTGEGQTINTFAVAMAKSLPDFVFNIGGRRIGLVPNAYAGPTDATPPLVDSRWKASSLAQLEVEETAYDGGGNLTYVRFLAYWEDSAWGNDYDMDVVSRIAACVADECLKHDDDNNAIADTAGSGELRVTTRIVQANAGVSMKVGYVIGGTGADGEYNDVVKLAGGAGNFSILATPPIEPGKEPAPSVNTFVPGTANASLLPTPLELAAKYGGFKDSNDNDEPDVATEWDEDGDGLADNYFFAEDPSRLGPRLDSFLNAAAETSSASAVVANSVSFQSSTRIYQARFDSADWTGQLLSFRVNPATGAIIDENVSTSALDPVWDASTVITVQYDTPADADSDDGRQIITLDPDNAVGIPFRWSSLTPAQQGLLDLNPATAADDDEGPQRISYLRGEAGNELRNGGSYRNRANTVDVSGNPVLVPNILGDNVNSSPAVVGVPDYGYIDTLESTATGQDPPNNLYSAFVLANDNVDCSDASREREPMVYFGANDGMLHGVSACNGEEKLAYVPSAVVPLLPQLTSPNYSHRYFVDGSPTVVDAFWDDAWGTVLVGSLRAGGQAVFALDITDPSQFLESNAADLVLWEISSADTGFADLGYTFSQPAVVKAKGDGWVSIFGNGFDSASGKAVLYVVDIDDGTRREAIVLDPGPNNGLSTVAPVDTDNDGEVDLIYAGDLKGNLWRIEANNSGFGSGGASLLYTAKENATDSQPITTRPEVGFHPTKIDGRMVFFGTGKYYQSDDGDPSTSASNTFYGIYDDDSGDTITSVTDHTSSTVLQPQVVEVQTVDTFGESDEFSYTIRVVSDETVDWATQSGWYLDLPDTAEKLVANPILRGGRIIFVTTIPSLSPCLSGGDSWLMEICADNGGRCDQAVFDLNGDGVFDFNDSHATTDDGGTTTYTSISGKKSKVGILQPPAIIAGVGGDGTGGYGKAEAKYSSGSDEGKIEVTIEDGGLPSQGRKSWIQFK